MKPAISIGRIQPQIILTQMLQNTVHLTAVSYNIMYHFCIHSFWLIFILTPHLAISACSYAWSDLAIFENEKNTASHYNKKFYL